MAASGFVTAYANTELDAMISSGDKVVLVTTMGTATTAGTAVTGGSYADGTPSWASAASSAKSTSAALSFTGMPDTSGVGGVKGIDIWNSGKTTRKFFGPLATTRVTSAGDTLTFATGAITVTLTNAT